jgi:hypothetical protein
VQDIPSNSGAGIFVAGEVDPDLKAARQSEFTAGIERELGHGLLFRGRYTHKNVDRAIEDIGIPTASGSEAYIIGNPGFGLADQFATDNGFPSVKAVRKYDATTSTRITLSAVSLVTILVWQARLSSVVLVRT